MKYIKKPLLAVLMAFASLTASAYDFEADGMYYNIVSLSNLTCEVASGGTSSGDVTIPSTVTYNGKTLCVVGIGEKAFRSRPNVTSITISNSVTSIGNHAFEGCSNLNSITLPNKLTMIGYGAFEDCRNLKSINIPSSVTTISPYAFSNTGLVSVSIPNGVTTIYRCAFKNCASLVSVVIPNSVTSIAEYTFQSCTKLEFVTIPNSVTSIGMNAFENCTSLARITIPNGVTNIEQFAFVDCSKLVSFTIPSSVTNIDTGAFLRCKSLKSVTIEDGETTLSLGNNSTNYDEKGLFYDCPLENLYLGRNLYYDVIRPPFYGKESLTSITISNSVTSIGMDAFANCTGITFIAIPSSVTTIDSKAFNGCTSLVKAEVGSAAGLKEMLNHVKALIVTEDYSSTSFPDLKYSSYSSLDTFICKLNTPPILYPTFSNSQYLNLEVIVPTESLKAYQSADTWKDFWCLKGGAEDYSTTGIRNMFLDNVNKPITIYDIQGRRLSAPQRGLNIINGKKVLVK